MRYFFTSDPHFFHRNILHHCNRPFADAHAMNSAICAQWNAQVQKTDRVYLLGDVSFGTQAETFRLLAELNGEICLITGNHDDQILANPYLQERFKWVKPYHEEKIDNQLIVLCHYPIAQWRDAQRGSWHLHGHTHGALQLQGAALDVGLDAHPNFRLWTWQEIQTRLSPIPPLPYPQKTVHKKSH